MSIINLDNISKYYLFDEVTSFALKHLSFTVDSKDMIAIMGASGAGKTTLLNILGCLDIPSSGDYFIDGKSIKNCTKKTTFSN